ncbi:hypothetical protein [Sulfuracidifex metallicus]|uniref:Uncharacterized protein n=1 Tax=Sulfuracidifex metallicus DSM 6482 = JCM 9184 TaxID=523847 RepID=A0A6A9QMS2_SULME|nr:hypothetical protein [Sulfuracidifex metallicus]MUN29028.1 hypothetical protein [Sulfuracidifex metallicus DSM 6482 = JCM 9184]WOE50464.1 hypothetical protein RQ359_001993 [Sulfuracidifex metallicus DSM 6482 = JCM 9184]
MIVTNGVSVTKTPWFKLGTMWYASAPFNSPIWDTDDNLRSGRNDSHCGASSSALLGEVIKQEALPVMAG